MTENALFRALRSHPFAAAALGICLVVSGTLLAATAYTEPETERQVHAHDIWTEAAAFSYSVPVTRNESIWPIGTDLGMGRAAYYRSVSQYVHVNFSWRAADAQPDSGMAQVELAQRLRGQDRQGRTLWEVVEPLAPTIVGDPSRGLVVGGTIDLDAVSDEIARLTKDLPLGDGIVNWTLEANLSYNLRTSAGLAGETTTYRFPIALNDPRLYLPAPDTVTWNEPHTMQVVTETVAPAGRVGLARAIPAHAMMALGIAALGGTLWARQVDPGRGLAPRDAAWAREHARHAEWVTPAASAREGSDWGSAFVDVPTLEDMVRIAADGRTRILFDPTTRTYYVPDPPLTYRYAKHARATTPAQGP